MHEVARCRERHREHGRQGECGGDGTAPTARERPRREQRERRNELHVVVAEEPQPDRDRQRGGEHPEPQIGVALAVERRFATRAPRARELPQQCEVARRECQRHQDEHGDDDHRPGVHAEVRAVAEHRPIEQLARADGQRDGSDRNAEPEGNRAHAALPARTGEQVHDGKKGGCAGLFRQRRDGDGGSGRAAAPSPREQDRRRHRWEHEHLEVRGLPILRRERDHREHEQESRDPPCARAVPTARFDGKQQRGQRDGEHRDDAHRPQCRRLEESERGGVDVRHERRFPVGRVLVERAALLDHMGLRRDERLVGVEDRHEERRQPEHEGDREEHEEHPS